MEEEGSEGWESEALWGPDGSDEGSPLMLMWEAAQFISRLN
jgi:hypothetical protein